MGTKMHLTGIAPSYASKWNSVYALREIIQNLLDVATEHNAEYMITHNRGVATLSDSGPGLALRHLVFGVSEKGENSIGQFGEGLKLGLLVAAREKRACSIRTGTYQVSPMIARDADMGTDVLALRIRNDMPQVCGTTVTYECTADELAAAKTNFAEFVEQQHVAPGLSLPGGRVYANGAAIWQGESLYSYHLTDKTLTNRDRDAAGMDRLLAAVRGVWVQVEDSAIVQNYLQHALSDSLPELERKINWSWHKPLQPDMWRTQVARIAGSERICITAGRADTDAVAEHLGQTVLRGDYATRYLLSQIGIPWAADIAKGATTGVEIKPRNLTVEEYAILRSAVRTVSRRCGDVGRIKLVEGLRVSGSRSMGCYCDSTDQITMDRAVLSSLRSTLSTLVHEQVHRLAHGAQDRTEEYQDAAIALVVAMLLSHKH